MLQLIIFPMNRNRNFSPFHRIFILFVASFLSKEVPTITPMELNYFCYLFLL
jgi:hypothetical protein